MVKIIFKHAKKMVKTAGKIISYGVLLMLGPLAVDVANIKDDDDEHDQVGYYDVIRVLAESDMFASNKHAVMAVLKHDESSDYYETVITILNSDMFTSNKIEMIRSLS